MGERVAVLVCVLRGSAGVHLDHPARQEAQVGLVVVSLHDHLLAGPVRQHQETVAARHLEVEPARRRLEALQLGDDGRVGAQCRGRGAECAHAHHKRRTKRGNSPSAQMPIDVHCVRLLVSPVAPLTARTARRKA